MFSLEFWIHAKHYKSLVLYSTTNRFNNINTDDPQQQRRQQQQKQSCIPSEDDDDKSRAGFEIKEVFNITI